MSSEKKREMVPVEGPSVMVAMADRFGMTPDKFERTLMETVMPKNTGPAQVAAFLLVCKRYSLDPFLREIFAFEGQGGGIRPIVSVDGWIRLCNDHPQFDGMELNEIFDEETGELSAVECVIYRKDRGRPTIVREWLVECLRGTEPWKRWPRRMLRHKALIQGARIAFGFSGLEDEDEYERYQEATGARPRYVPREDVPRASIDLNQAREGIAVDPPGGSTFTESVVKDPSSAPALRKEDTQAKPEPVVRETKAKAKPRVDAMGWPIPEEDPG